MNIIHQQVKMKDQLINKEFDIRILEILVCPPSKDKFFYNKKTNSLDSKKSGLSYPIRDSIPVLIIAEATTNLNSHSKISYIIFYFLVIFNYSKAKLP